MRSRYTAFCLKDMKYISRTTHPKSQKAMNEEVHREWAEKSKFTQLEIIKSSQVGDSGFVEFRAHYEAEGEKQIHHELSSFRRENGVWYFLNGRQI
jgi:SEC-C motif domain protein